MSKELDIRYINNISSSLHLFKWHRAGKVAAARCPICGDSKTDKTKTRLYFFIDVKKDRDGFAFHCKNCGAGGAFGFFLKDYFPNQFQEYKLERLREVGKGSRIQSERISALPEPSSDKTPQESPSPARKMLMLSDIPKQHMAYQYAIGRGIPEHKLQHIAFTPNFREWCDEWIGETDGHVPDDPRILFVLKKQGGEVFGAQGRVFYESDKKSRFITAKREGETHPKFFGTERVNTSLPLIVVEGAIDSLFLPNCIALCGGDVSEFVQTLSDQVFCVLDNEPRSIDTIKRMRKAIDLGYKVCFWKIDTKYKDINDMVHKGGMSVKGIMEHIAKNSFSGIRANLEMSRWAKV